MSKSFKDLTEEEYRSYPLESYSSLKSLLSSSEAFLKQQESPFEGNEYTDLGTAIHNLLQGLDQEKTLPPKSISTVNAIKKQLMSKDLTDHLQGKYEVAFKTKYKDLPYKGKVDIYNKDMSHIGEIKTSSKATDLKSFRKEAYSRDYDLQAAMYLHMSKCKYHYFIVVNTVEPYNINVYPTSEIFIRSGFIKLDKIVKAYAKIFQEEGSDDSEV